MADGGLVGYGQDYVGRPTPLSLRDVYKGDLKYVDTDVTRWEELSTDRHRQIQEVRVRLDGSRTVLSQATEKNALAETKTAGR